MKYFSIFHNSCVNTIQIMGELHRIMIHILFTIINYKQCLYFMKLISHTSYFLESNEGKKKNIDPLLKLLSPIQHPKLQLLEASQREGMVRRRRGYGHCQVHRQQMVATSLSWIPVALALSPCHALSLCTRVAPSPLHHLIPL